MTSFIQKLTGSDAKGIALRFVLMFGVISLFADFTYEGSRSIVGPYLAQLGANGTAVGIIAGLGELLGYALRVVSGRVAEKTGAFWPITLFGYAIQMISVPLLALAGSWQVAALLIVAERIGRATRNPPRDVMLSHAGKVIGFGWAFGLNEALDQTGAMIACISRNEDRDRGKRPSRAIPSSSVLNRRCDLVRFSAGSRVSGMPKKYKILKPLRQSKREIASVQRFR